MNFYKRHLGDYAKDTRHLSALEHGVYNLLLDYYYATEKPIPEGLCERIALAYATDEKEAVLRVLGWFFVKTSDGWKNGRCEEVIAESADKSMKAKESALKRWQCDGNANASKSHDVRNASHKPLTTTKKKEPARTRAESSGMEIDTWLDSLPEDADPIPSDDPIIDYAAKAGIPLDYLELAWDRFAEDYRNKRKRQKDWPGTFRNAVKGNWGKLWWFTPDGECRLTTAGEQARRASA